MQQRDTYDAAWKDALDTYLREFLDLCAPEIHAAIDWSRGYETRDKELQAIAPVAAKKQTVDVLVAVYLHGGGEHWLALHIEVQNQRDTALPERMFRYNTRLFDTYRRPIASIAVLGDQQAGWRPDQFAYAALGCRVGMEFPAIKLRDLDSAMLAASTNIVACIIEAHLLTMATQRKHTERAVQKFALIRSIYNRGFDAEQIRQAYRFIDTLMRLPKSLDATVYAQVQQFEQERQMTYITTAERIGIEKGERIGIEKGERVGVKKTLVTAIEAKFGAHPPQVDERLTSLIERLDITPLMLAILEAETIDELTQRITMLEAE